MKKRIQTMITAFRDGFQSYFGARVLTKDFLPAFEAAVDAGLRHIEVGGGARFQSLYFYCNEDAFEMMDTLRSIAGPEADLQTLSRGINVVGLESQSRDIIDLHARMFAKHGVSTIRNFDALNDVDNLVYSGRRIAEAGANHEVSVTMMGLPPGLSGAHDPDFYIGVLRKILDADIPYASVCFKDASGTTPPSVVHETIKQARALLGEQTHIVFHSHESAGVSIAQYLAAIYAGADQVDCSLAPVSGGTCQPDLVTLWGALRGTDYDLGIDIDRIREVESIFRECMEDYFVPPEALAVEPTILFSPMPGGALTANTQMMRDNGILDRYPEVIGAMTEVVERGGFGTSVTPVSQFYFQQAFNNVMFGPWQRMAEGYGKMVLGYFGKTPVPPDPKIVERASELMELEPTDRAPIDINDDDPAKGIDAATKMLDEAGLPHTDENVFIAATCKEKGIAYLKGEAKVNVRKNEPEAEGKADVARAGATAPGAASARDSSAAGAATYIVTVNGESHEVTVDDGRAVVDGVPYAVDLALDGTPPAGSAPAPAAAPGGPESSGAGGEAVTAPFAGLLLRVEAKPGTTVAKGATVVVLESMKMETPLASPVTGVVESVRYAAGDQIESGAVVATVRAS
ncbi:MAG: biotin/lipoyl-containing protein [Spirochaetota bacterium]